CMQATELPWTF
nr:immunoglobulin light chain junction region [Macaca mulatta]